MLYVNSNVIYKTWEVIILWYLALMRSDPENFIQDYPILTKKKSVGKLAGVERHQEQQEFYKCF